MLCSIGGKMTFKFKMDKVQITLMFFLMPFLAIAHGEEVMVWYGIELVIWFSFILFISLMRMSKIQRLCIIIAFLSSQLVCYYTFENMSYLENRLIIVLISFFLPLILVLLTLGLFIKLKKNK